MNMDRDQDLSFNQEFTPVVKRNNPVPVFHRKADQDQAWWLIDENSGKEYSLAELPCVIGRSRECAVVIRDKGVSRQHAHILEEDGALLIRDLGSTNGIRVNRKRYVECRLFDGDIVGVGNDHEFTLRSRPAAPLTAKAIEPSATSKPKGPRSTGAGFQSYTSYHSSTKPAVPEEEHDDPIIFAVEEASTSPVADVLRWVVFFLILIAAGLVARYVFLDEAPSLYPSPKITPQNQSVDSQEGAENEGEVFVVHPSVASLEGLSTPPAPIPPPITERPSSLLTDKVPWRGNQQNNSAAGNAVGESPLSIPEPPSAPDSAKKRMELQQKAETNYLAGNVTDAILLLDQSARAADFTKEDQQALSDIRLLYRNLLDQYLEGDRLFNAGQTAKAFNLWAEFVKAEKEIFGNRKSKYAMKVGKNVTDSVMESAKNAYTKAEYHKAWRLWEKAKMIGVDDRGKDAMASHEERVIKLYNEALALEKSNPDRAISLLQQVEKLVPPGTEYNAKASGKIDLMKNWGGGPVN